MAREITKTESNSDTELETAQNSLKWIVETHMFSDVLYSETSVERTTSDGFFPAKRADEIEWNVETARSIGIDEPDQVLVPRGSMTLSGSYPFTSVVFFDQMVGRGQLLRYVRGPPKFENNGYALEQLYRAAVESAHYAVELVEANYETGNVTITVEKTV